MLGAQPPDGLRVRLGVAEFLARPADQEPKKLLGHFQLDRLLWRPPAQVNVFPRRDLAICHAGHLSRHS